MWYVWSKIRLGLNRGIIALTYNYKILRRGDCLRDKNRIKPFLKQFEKLWTENPDYRFGQLVSAISNVDDAFYIEDDILLKNINSFIKPQEKDI